MLKYLVMESDNTMELKKVKQIIKHPLKARKKCILYRKLGKLGNNSDIGDFDIITEPQRIFIGDESQILDHCRIQSYPALTEINNRIEIGNHCYLGFYLTILAGENISIGDNVLMASNVLITSQGHGTDPESSVPYMDQQLKCSPIEIGSGTWIGEKVSIMPGVTIGKKCIIGANSVVTHDIPDFCLAVGAPANVIKKYSFETHSWMRVETIKDSVK